MVRLQIQNFRRFREFFWTIILCCFGPNVFLSSATKIQTNSSMTKGLTTVPDICPPPATHFFYPYLDCLKGIIFI